MVESRLGRIESGLGAAGGVPRARPRRERAGGDRDARDFESELESKPMRATVSGLEVELEARAIRADLGDTGRSIDVVA